MIRLEQVSIIFQGRPLLQNINWQLRDRCRVGLVGVNGSGKSTLLKIINGQQEIDSGKVIVPKNFSVGYLPQELYGVSEKTVFDEALSGCGSAREIELQIEQLTSAMQNLAPESEEYHDAVLEYGRLQRLFEAMDGFSLEAKTSRVLEGLRIPAEWWPLPIKQLSGGWQMRIHLAKLILSQPSLLLLDEPTNHLDVESILWFSAFLRNYEGSAVLISHDRYFLDENIREIVEISNRKLHFYAGNYSFYVKEKEKRLELLESTYRNQQEEIARIQQFIDRFRYKASKAKQVQSRILMLEKMERVELPPDTSSIRLRIPPAQRAGRVVIEAQHLGHSYSGKQVFSDASFIIQRGEKIALVGVNGAGKTTLLKIVAGFLDPSHGEFRLGHNVSLAYYAQLVTDQLQFQNTILDEISSSAPEKDQTEIRSLLGSFLFSGEDVYKKIHVLSGGEKSRVALAKILLKHSNLLLLDEPTNHLDMASKEILIEALQKYEGTVVFVSHDRYFMDAIASRVFELKDGTLNQYFGNYTEYLRKISEVSAGPQVSTASPTEKSHYKSKEQKKIEAELRQSQARWKKEVIEPLEQLELSIQTHEQRLKEIETILSDHSIYSMQERYSRYLEEYDGLKKKVEKEYKRWEELQKKKEEWVEASR